MRFSDIREDSVGDDAEHPFKVLDVILDHN